MITPCHFCKYSKKLSAKVSNPADVTSSAVPLFKSAGRSGRPELVTGCLHVRSVSLRHAVACLWGKSTQARDGCASCGGRAAAVPVALVKQTERCSPVLDVLEAPSLVKPVLDRPPDNTKLSPSHVINKVGKRACLGVRQKEGLPWSETEAASYTICMYEPV